MHLILTLLACASQPAAQETVTAAWDHDPAEAAALINSLPSELEQIAAVETLLQDRSAAERGFCRRLDPGAAANRCTALNRRPHLHKTPTADRHDQGPGAGPRAAPGPSTVAILPDLPPSTWPPAEHPPGCDDSACLRAAASEAAISGDTERALGFCTAETSLDARQECAFITAEQVLRVRGLQGHASAAGLCIQAGDFAARCFDHMTSRLTRDAPALSAPAEDWAPLIAKVQAVQRYWADKDPSFGQHQADRIWSQALWNAINPTATADGTAFDTLPSQAAPHVRAALSWQLMSAPGATPDTLEQWVARVESAEQRRDSMRAQPRDHGPGGRFSKTPAPFWSKDQPGDESIPAIFAFGSSRRTWSSDPHIDATICVIETAARLWGGDCPVVVQGTQSDDERVRWTAERLRRSMAQRERYEATRP